MLGKFEKMFQQAQDEHKRQLWAAATQSSQPAGEGGHAPSRDAATAGVFLGQTSWGNTKQKNKSKSQINDLRNAFGVALASPPPLPTEWHPFPTWEAS